MSDSARAVTGLRMPAWLFPGFSGYQRRWLGNDLLAGLSAGAVVIPQAMAYATIANLPVQVGLYTCIVPMVVYVLLGGSRAMSVSTTSTIATLTASTLVTVGVAAGSKDVMGSVITLTLLVGAILLVMRLLKLGSLVENISKATIIGVQCGVGATVAVGQLPKLFGVDTNFTGHGFIRSIIAVVEALPGANWPTVILSVVSVALLVVLKRLAPAIPAALIIVVGGIALVAFSGIRSDGVDLIAQVPQGLPIPHLPDFTHTLDLLPGALGIALMAFLETVAVARGIRTSREPQIDSNRELLAISAASIAGSFFYTLPAAGGFSQSAVNQNSGAKSQLAQATTVVLAILVALFLGPVLSLLPQATLASLVFVAVLGLIDVKGLVRLARISPRDFWIALVTAGVGLTLGLLPAVLVGVVTTLVLVLRELNTPLLEIEERRGDALAIHLARGLYTANVLENERAILALVDQQQPPIRVLVLNLERLSAISITVLDALEDLDRELSAKGITLHVACMPQPSIDIAGKLPWYQQLETSGRSHATVADAFATLR
ncbi:SulP family inorganic anion transporter [Humibacter sp. RRB41]|uniref:SulP family inorganic anion transporter n=1 Tax=Humibacter sp. RRB41 TaxID=2919946 RepID=UPI0035B2329C